MFSSVTLIALAGIFGLAAVRKSGNLRAFATAVRSWELVHPSRSYGAAVVIVFLEGCLSVGLGAAVPFGYPSLGLAVATTVLATTLALQMAIRAWTSSARCGCFGNPSPLGVRTMVLPGVMLALSTAGLAAA